MTYAVGQDVIYVGYGQPRKTKVARVGRKYFYISASHEPFDLDSGRAKDHNGYVETVDAHAKATASAAARKELRAFGVDFVEWSVPHEKILAVRAALAGLMAEAGEKGCKA